MPEDDLEIPGVIASVMYAGCLCELCCVFEYVCWGKCVEGSFFSPEASVYKGVTPLLTSGPQDHEIASTRVTK